MVIVRIEFEEELTEYFFCIDCFAAINTFLFNLVIWIEVFAQKEELLEQAILIKLECVFNLINFDKHIEERSASQQWLETDIHETRIQLIFEALI